MSDNREDSLILIDKRVAPLFLEVPLEYIKRNPDKIITTDDLPCVLIQEGADIIIKDNKRGQASNAEGRELTLIIECWEKGANPVKELLKKVKEKIDTGGMSVLNTKSFIQEGMSVGPFNLPFPKSFGMRIIYKLTYIVG